LQSWVNQNPKTNQFSGVNIQMGRESHCGGTQKSTDMAKDKFGERRRLETKRRRFVPKAIGFIFGDEKLPMESRGPEKSHSAKGGIRSLGGGGNSVSGPIFQKKDRVALNRQINVNWELSVGWDRLGGGGQPMLKGARYRKGNDEVLRRKLRGYKTIRPGVTGKVKD